MAQNLQVKTFTGYHGLHTKLVTKNTQVCIILYIANNITQYGVVHAL